MNQKKMFGEKMKMLMRKVRKIADRSDQEIRV